MQISTRIQNYKKRNEIYKYLKDQYPVSKTDNYLNIVNNNYNFLTRGKLVEFRSVDLGEDSRSRRITKLENDLENDTDTILNLVEEQKERKIDAVQRIPELEKEIDDLDLEIKQLEKQNNFIKKISRNKSLQSQFKDLRERKILLENELIQFKSILEEIEPSIDNNLRNWADRKEIIEQALIRENALLKIESTRIERLKKEKEKIIKGLKDLESKDTIIKPANSLVQKKKISKNTRIQTFIEKRAIYHNKNLATIELRSKRLELKRIDELLGRLENAQTGKGRVRERYYISENFEKNKDLVVFSRRFRGSENIESEMSHTPRVSIDTEESLKTMMYLIWALLGLNAYLLISDVLGLEQDLFNFHSFYILVISLIMLRNTFKIQGKDHIFNAKYFYLDSSYIDIQYRDKENVLRSFEALCYHLELFYSDKQNIDAFIQTTEADIIEASDTRLINLVQRQQKELSQQNLEIVGYQEEVMTLTDQNQEGVKRYARVEKNAEANVKRTMNYRDLDKGPKGYEQIGMSIIRYAGISVVILLVGSLLSDMGGIINITSSGEGDTGFNFTVGATIGFIVGIFSMVLINRFQR